MNFLHAPSIALEKATGMSLANSIFLTCTICVIYTAIGGLKAVIFNDVMQAIIIWIGFIAVIWLTLDLMDKSLFEVFDIVSQDQRLYKTDWETNPQIRHTIWSIFIGGWCLWSYLFSVNQSVVSRQLSCKSLGQARGSCYVSACGCGGFAKEKNIFSVEEILYSDNLMMSQNGIIKNCYSQDFFVQRSGYH